MADSVNATQLEMFLQELGKRYPAAATLYLLGGSALILLGSQRGTLDVDYVGIDNPGLWNDLQRMIADLAQEMDLKIDAVPYNEMIPPLTDSAQRQIPVGVYGKLQVFIVDPYAMALGKLDRGFPTDLQDLVFMLQRNLLQLDELEKTLREILPQAREFDLTPKQMQENLATVRQMLKP